MEDNQGRSPLDYAVGNHLWGRSPRVECIDVALYLISLGCGGKKQLERLLFEACGHGRLDVVKEMIEKHSINPDGRFKACRVYVSHKISLKSPD